MRQVMDIWWKMSPKLLKNNLQNRTCGHTLALVEFLRAPLKLPWASFFRFFRKSIFGYILVALWLTFGSPFDSLWGPFGSRWPPFGSLCVPFRSLLAPFGYIVAPFCSLFVSLGACSLNFAPYLSEKTEFCTTRFRTAPAE